MKHRSRFAMALGLCVVSTTAVAQNATVPFAKSVCIKVQPGKDADFNRLVTDVLRPSAQVRADAGEFVTQFLMKSVYPAGMDAACDYTLVTLYKGFPPDPKAMMPLAAAFEKAHVAMKPSDVVGQRDAVSRLRRSELWMVRQSLGKIEVGNYARHNFVKVAPDDMTQWLTLESETFKPVHQARIDMGAFKGWALVTLAMPSGSALPYNAMTVDFYKDWASLAAPSQYQEAFQKTGKGEMSAAFAQSNRLRGAFVRTELDEVVGVVTPHSPPASAER
ncbi:MAG: hypothetical protein ABI165_03690 [Bryobacteraceae bacterium]